VPSTEDPQQLSAAQATPQPGAEHGGKEQRSGGPYDAHNALKHQINAMGVRVMPSISNEDAQELIGRALYGKDWVQRSDRERFLQRRYASTPEEEVFARHGEELGREIQRARDRADWHLRQSARVFNWLERHGFAGRHFDSDQFEKAFDADFGSAASDPRPLVSESADEQRSAGSEKASQAYVPGYLAVVFRAIREHDITDDNQPKAEALQEWFQQQSVDGEPISQNLARAMTTIVRRPDRRKGGIHRRQKKG
jgi:hypothetical protein